MFAHRVVGVISQELDRIIGSLKRGSEPDTLMRQRPDGIWRLAIQGPMHVLLSSLLDDLAADMRRCGIG